MTVLPSVGTLKRTALQSLQRSGCAGLVGTSRWRRERLLILAYHGISQADEHHWDPALYLPPDALDERFCRLRKLGCTVFPLHEALHRLYSGTLEDRSVAVTFDDGYCDFVTQAFPLLQKYSIPATVYLPTLRVGGNAPVFRLLCSYMFWKSKQRRVHVPELRQEPFEIGDGPARAQAVDAISAAIKRRGMTRSDRDALVAAVADRLAFDYDAVLRKRLFQVMPQEDVARLAAAGVDFQLHTHTHTTPLDRELFAREIATNRDRIEQLTGTRPTHFCYPSGNYDPRFLPWLRGLGVTSATTCDPGLASRTTPPLMLPRFVDTRTIVEFEGWLTGTAALLSRRASYASPVS